MFTRAFSFSSLQECLKPLHRIVEGDAVDLTVKIEGTSKKQSRLIDAINRLIAKFHGAIVKSAATSLRIARIAPQLAALSQALKEQAQRQQLHADDIAAAGTMQQKGARLVAEQINGVAGAARHQLQGAIELATLTETMGNNCEELLMSIGVLRFDRHRAVQAMVEDAAAALMIEDAMSPHIESYLENLAKNNACLELLYVADRRGHQISSNVSPAGHDRSAIGSSWSERPWFTAALGKRRTYVSNIYRSVATGNFCFTVSTPLFNKAREVIAVLAADVRFDQILEIN